MSNPRVNLIPSDIIIAERLKKGKAAASTAASVLAAVIIGFITFLFVDNSIERAKVDKVKAEVEAVKQAQAEYSDFAYYQLENKAFENFKEEVTADEVNWSEFLGLLTSSIPGDSQIYSFDVEVDDELVLDEDSLEADEELEEPTEKEFVFNAVISTPDLPSLREWEETLAGLEDHGFNRVTFSESVNNDGVYHTSIQLYFNDGLLWKRFSDE